jgi:hypothetical protein
MHITTPGYLRGYPLAPRGHARNPGWNGNAKAGTDLARWAGVRIVHPVAAGRDGAAVANRMLGWALLCGLYCFLPTTVRQSLPNGSVATQLFMNSKPCLVKAIANSASVMDRRYRTGAGP